MDQIMGLLVPFIAMGAIMYFLTLATGTSQAEKTSEYAGESIQG